MDEGSARAVAMLRAIEIVDRDRALWTDVDRAWASRAAAEVVGERADPETFLARRAGFAMERIAERHRSVPRVLGAFGWRGWITPLLVIVAFAAGMAIDQIGGSGRINILAPPVLGLLAWNLAVYVGLGVRAVLRVLRRQPATPGPIRRWIAAIAGAAPRIGGIGARSPLEAAITAFAADWTRLATPLYAARAARILHVSAAVLAAGVIAGLFLRGLAFEYRASWQSTFLDAEQVQRIVSIALAPGAMLTGLSVPDVAHVAAIRSSGAEGGENAALWLYLFTGTIVALVIVPRLVLALVDGWIEQRRASSFAWTMDDPYFRRVLRGFREGPLAVIALPYSFTVPDASMRGLGDVVARMFGPRAKLDVAAMVSYGAEDSLPPELVPSGTSIVIALFNATATPESESHGAFVAAVQRATRDRADLVAIVDESAFRERWPEDEKRLEDRRAAWRELFAARAMPFVFIHLARPDLGAAEAGIERALEGEAA